MGVSFSFKQPLVCVAQSVGSTPHDKLNMRNLSCGGEPDLEITKKVHKFFTKNGKKKQKWQKWVKKRAIVKFCS